MSLNEARADIWLKPGTPLEVAKLRQAVTKAGFTPTWVEFEALGQLVNQNGRSGFKIKGSQQVVLLQETENLADLRKKASGKEVFVIARIPEKEKVARIKSFSVR